MDYKREINKCREVVIVEVVNENAQIVKDGKASKGDYVILKMGMYHVDILLTKYLRMIEEGLDDSIDTDKSPITKVSKAESDKHRLNILKRKDKVRYAEEENKRLQAELNAIRHKAELPALEENKADKEEKKERKPPKG